MSSEDAEISPKVVGAPPSRIIGKDVVLEHLELHHVAEIWQVIQGDDGLWTYMLGGPFANYKEYAEVTEKTFMSSDDPYMYAIIDAKSGKAIGHASFMRWDRTHRSLEIGHVLFSKLLKRTRAATEAYFLLMQTAFDTLNIRRLEWKCNAKNVPSFKAAERLGFSFEGIFRQHYIVKGRNRDSAWFSMLDGEWSEAKAAFALWLHSDNFDEQGQQKQTLLYIRKSLSVKGESEQQQQHQ